MTILFEVIWWSYLQTFFFFAHGTCSWSAHFHFMLWREKRGKWIQCRPWIISEYLLFKSNVVHSLQRRQKLIFNDIRVYTHKRACVAVFCIRITIYFLFVFLSIFYKYMYTDCLFDFRKKKWNLIILLMLDWLISRSKYYIL